MTLANRTSNEILTAEEEMQLAILQSSWSNAGVLKREDWDKRLKASSTASSVMCCANVR